MSPGSFSIGRIAGIPLLVHWSVLLIAAFVGSSLAAAYGGPGAVLAVGAFLASILLHELAHALVARRYGVRTMSIQLWALGGVARLDREAPTARAEGAIAIAGPLTSFAIGLVTIGTMFGMVAAEVLDDSTLFSILGWIGVINIVLAVFNLLPGAPLDGGRVLKAWRWGRHGDRYRAAREAGTAGKAVGGSLAGIGVVMLFNGLPGVMLVVTGLFIALSAHAEILATDLAERLRGIHVRDLTWFGVAHATADTDTDTMLWQRSRLGGAGVVAVERPDGELAGVVSEESMLTVPESRRAWTTLDRLMVPMERTTHADPDDELASVLARLDPTQPLVTVWRSGRLVGVIPRRKLLERLRNT